MTARMTSPLFLRAERGRGTTPDRRSKIPAKNARFNCHKLTAQPCPTPTPSAYTTTLLSNTAMSVGLQYTLAAIRIFHIAEIVSLTL